VHAESDLTAKVPEPPARPTSPPTSSSASAASAASAPLYPLYRVRSAQYDAIYVSPHMDDAIYSCGGQIALQRAQGQRVLVVTVFGHGASAEHGPGIFRDYTQRKREEQAAITRLDADYLWLNQPDLLVRHKPLSELVRYAVPFVSVGASPLRDRIEAAIYALCTRLLAAEGQLYVPLAVGAHPDHRLVFDAVRAMSSRARAWTETFYEDVPYAQVPAVRADRLHYLGLSRPRSLSAALYALREMRAFVFPLAPVWLHPVLTFMVGLHWATSRLFYRLFGRRAAIADERKLSERVIDAVIDDKVAAMRAYATQTAFFYPEGEALYDTLVRSNGHYVERYWKLIEPTDRTLVKAQPDLPLDEELARVDQLLQQLQRPE
jgi:LmbE family N-acetylglucosaminyl deacetylase